VWGTPRRKLAPVAVLFLAVELTFFSSNITKVEHGAWLPLVIALIMSLVMLNWRRGQVVVTRNRVAKEGVLEDFLATLPAQQPPVLRVPGVAIYLNPNKTTTPLALRAEVEHNHTLHERVLIVSVETVSVPYVDEYDQFAVQVLGEAPFKATHITIHLGYQDRVDVPATLRLCRKHGLLERNLDLEHASYFVSRITITPNEASGPRSWRKRLFIAMARNAASPVEHFGLPREQTVMMGSHVSL
jgi:KUP system potassium uptake protein